VLRKQDATRVNFSQRLPYFSEAIKKNPEVFQILENSIDDICNYVHHIISTHGPSEYEEIKAFVDVLPLNHYPKTYPFASFVLNVQGSAVAHKDAGDKIWCVTIPFGQFSGGSLVLHEPGIVIERGIGDVMIFPSSNLTHFNLDFKGVRGSMILFSDRHGDDWVRFRNGWNEHLVVKAVKDVA
jgi:hypothetical protein